MKQQIVLHGSRNAVIFSSALLLAHHVLRQAVSFAALRVSLMCSALLCRCCRSLQSVLLLPGRKRASSSTSCILFSFSGYGRGPFLLRREVSQVKYCPSPWQANLRLLHTAGVRRALLCPLCPSSVCLYVLLFQTESSLVLIWPYIVISYY